MKPTCSNCKKYDSEGYCNHPKVTSRRRKEKPTTWCMNYEEREGLVEEDCPDGTGDDDHRECSSDGNARSMSTYETRVEMGRAQVVLRWDDDSEEISVSIYLEGEPSVAAHFMADLCSDRSNRTRPVLGRLGGHGDGETSSQQRSSSGSA